MAKASKCQFYARRRELLRALERSSMSCFPDELHSPKLFSSPYGESKLPDITPHSQKICGIRDFERISDLNHIRPASSPSVPRGCPSHRGRDVKITKVRLAFSGFPPSIYTLISKGVESLHGENGRATSFFRIGRVLPG